MANSDKNIRITTSKNKTTFPNIVFTGSSAGTSVLTLEVRDDNTVAFTGSDGDVFSLDYNLSTGTIWSVNDKSGTPFLRASAGGTIGIAEFGTGVIVGIGQTNPKYKLDVQGWVGFASTGDGSYTVLVENGLTTGNNAFSIRAANALRFYNSGNTFYTGFIGAQSGVNTTYTLPATSPATGSSVLQATSAGIMSWVPMTSSSSSGTVNSGTSTFAAYYATSSTAVSENSNLQFTGSGVSVGGNVQSSSTTTGSLQVRGGFAITGNAFIGGTVNITSSTVSTSTISGALVVSGGAGIAGSLYTGTGFSSSISGVVLANNTINASTYNKVTITAPASSATLTIADGSSLITSGSNSLTLTTTAASNITFPTAGTLTTTGNKLSVFAATTSAELIGVISDETGSGALVFATSPTLTTPNIGAATGTSLYLSAVSPSTSATTGALTIPGGVGIGLSASIGGRLQIFNGANYTAFVSSATGNTVYSLPTTSPATGSSVLQSTAAGVMSWVPMTGGSASPGGTLDGSIQFKSSSSFGGTRSLFYDTLLSSFRVSGYPGTDVVSSANAAFSVEQSYGSFNGNLNGTMIAVNSASGFIGSLLHMQVNNANRFIVSYTGAVTFANAFTFPTTDGTSNQVLQTNGSGTVSWATVSSSGAGSGTVAIPGAQYQIAAYYSGTGASVSGSATFTNNTATGVVEITHTTESTSTTTGALQVDGGAGIAKSLFVGTTISVGEAPNYNIPNNLASFTSTVNSYNQLVIANKSNGTSASANLVVNNDQSNDSVFYGEIGMNSSTFSGTGALGVANAVYVASTSSPLVLGTTTQHPIRFVVNGSATDMMFIDGAGLAISVFTNLDLRSANDIRFFNSGNTFSTALQASNNTASYTLSLPTAPVGGGTSTIMVDTSGNMYFTPFISGSGISIIHTAGSGITVRAKRPLNIVMSSGYTPIAAGPDNAIIRIPDSPSDGTSLLTFVPRELYIRVETPSAGSSRIQLEKSTGVGAFTLAASGSSYLGGSGLTITGAGTYVTSTTSFAGTFLTSGDNLRLSWSLLNATHANFFVSLLLEEV